MMNSNHIVGFLRQLAPGNSRKFSDFVPIPRYGEDGKIRGRRKETEDEGGRGKRKRKEEEEEIKDKIKD